MDDQTTLSDVLKLVQADPTDARARLKLAELYVKASDFTNAIAAFECVGKFYAQQGYVMKSVGAYRQVRTLLSEKAPQLAGATRTCSPFWRSSSSGSVSTTRRPRSSGDGRGAA